MYITTLHHVPYIYIYMLARYVYIYIYTYTHIYIYTYIPHYTLHNPHETRCCSTERGPPARSPSNPLESSTDENFSGLGVVQGLGFRGLGFKGLGFRGLGFMGLGFGGLVFGV